MNTTAAKNILRLILILGVSTGVSLPLAADEAFECRIYKESDDLVLEWDSVPGIHYYIYATESLDGTWQLVDDMTSTQTSSVWKAPLSSIPPKSFYMIKQNPVYIASTTSTLTTDVDFNLQRAKNFLIQTSIYMPNTVKMGRLFFRTTPSLGGNKNSLYVDNNVQLFDLKKDIRNVKAFGAKGDGVTDDSAAIQAAIDDVNGPGKVFFPPGVYLVSQPVMLEDTGYLVFEGSGYSTIIRASPDFIGSAIIKNKTLSLSGVVARDFAIEGHPDLAGLIGIHLINHKSPRLSNIKINMFGAIDSVGILWERIQSGGMDNITIEGAAGSGIHFRRGATTYPVSGVVLKGINIRDGGYSLGTGMLIEESSFNMYRVNIEHPSEHGIYCSEGNFNAFNVIIDGGDSASVEFNNCGGGYSIMTNCSLINPAGTALNIISSYGTIFKGGVIDGAVNISADSHLIKFDRVREADNFSVSDSSNDSYWDSIKGSDDNSVQDVQSPLFGRDNSGTAARIFSGSGSPQGVVAAPVGSLYMRSYTTGACLYVKESGTGSTGWVLK